jgi:hypothetical protein
MSGDFATVIDAKEDVLTIGPSGVGESHATKAIALPPRAVRRYIAD